MKKLNITFCSFPDYSGNARALYNYMKKKYKDNMNYTWVTHSKKMKDELEKKNITAVVKESTKFKQVMNKTDIIFTTHGDLIRYKKDNSIYVELWHGLSSKKIGFMVDNILKNDYEWYSFAREKIDYVIVPSEFWKVIFATRFNLEFKQILALGYPKLDEFKNKNAHKNLDKVLNTDTSKYKKIMYYMPTYRKGEWRETEDSKVGINILNLKEYDENKLVKYLKDNNYLLCIKKHPSEKNDYLKEFSNLDNIKLINEEDLSKNLFDVYDILDAADVMITDYSSLGTEFLFLNKPVIYVNNDIDEYKKNRGICYNDFNFWASNASVKTIEDFIKKIDDCNKNSYEAQFSEKRKLFFGDLKNGGCANICNYFFTDDNQLKVKPYENEVRKLQSDLAEATEKKEKYKRLAKEQKEELNSIYNSKGWKMLEKMRKAKKKITK